MNSTLRILILIAALCMPPCLAFADYSDLDISCVTKKLDQKTITGTAENAVTVDTEDWVYAVTLQNNTFKDLTNIEVRYIIFYKIEALGTVAGTRVGRQAGVAKIDAVKAHDKVDFQTSAVKLEKQSLKPGMYYPNGGRTAGDAALSGLWIRIYQNGTMIAEMSRPPALASKEKWDE